MNLPHLSVNRPTASTMVFLGLCIIGAVALFNLPIELMPNISFGQINITVQVRGGIPSSEIEERVAKPIEEAMGTVTHLKDLLSISKEGECTVVLEFTPGTDMDFAALEVREKFARIKEKLPREIERPVIAQYGYGDVPIMILAVTSDRYTPEELRDMVDDKVKERLNRVEGVAMIEVAGGRERKILIEVDQSRLVAYSLSIEKVIEILNLSNLNLLAGDIEQFGSKFLIRAMGEFQSLDEIKDMAVSLTPQGGAIRVKDVAEVKDSYLEATSFARMDIKPVVSLYIQKESLANTIRVARGIEQEIGKLGGELDKDIHLTLTFNQADFVKKAVARVNESLVQGGVLAIAVLFLFLMNLASIFIISVSIPISVITIFSLIYLMNLGLKTDITLNVMTLSGLALAVGMLVDNTIVVLENIFKRREEELPTSKIAFHNLAISSTDEMTLAITASTFTTVIVFLPLLFVNKEIQLLYGGLGITVTLSLLISLLVAISLVPMLASRLLKPIKPAVPAVPLPSEEPSQLIDKPEDYVGGVRQSFFKKFKNAYQGSLKFVLTLRYIFIPLIFALFIFSLKQSTKLEKEFIGIAEQNKFTVFIEMPTGTRLEVSDKIVKEVEKIVSEVAEKKSATARIEPWSSKIYVELQPLDKRKRSTQQIIEELRPKVEVLEPAFIYFEEPEEIATKEILIEIYGYDYEKLKDLATEIGSHLQGIERLTDVKIRMREGRPEMRLLIDKERASLFGWSVEEIAEVIHAQMRGLIPTRYHAKQDAYVRLKEDTLYPEKARRLLTEEQAVMQKKEKEKKQLRKPSLMPKSYEETQEVEIIGRLQERFRRTFSDLHRLILMTPEGKPIYLEQMSDFRLELGPSEVWRKNKSRMVQVSANMGGQALGTVANKVSEVVKDIKFPEGYYWRFGGNYEKMTQNQKELSFAFGLTIILVYMVLAALFESLIQPFIILASVPLATIGVVGALHFTHKPIGIGVLIGAIMLAGIVVNNAIILVDSTNRLRQQRKGEPLKEVVAVSSGDRLRPILMTTITTLLGLIPMVLDKSEAANLWSPLALTVMAGLFTSTFFTLYIVPSIYIVFSDFRGIFRGKRGR